MNYLLLFGLISVGVIWLLGLAFLFLSGFFTKPREFRPLDNPTKTQALSSILALFFGTTASIGGAIATLQVASLGLDISEKQNEFQNTLLVIDKFDNAVNLYSTLLASMSDVYAVALPIAMHIRPRDSKFTYVDEKLMTELHSELLILSESYMKLSDAVFKIQKDDFANFCIQRELSKPDTMMDHISNSLRDHGVMPSQVLFANDLSFIRASINVASRRSQSRIDIDNAILYSIPEDIPGFEFAGNLIGLTRGHDGPTVYSRMYIAKWGSAILHDLQESVPDGELIWECLENRYHVDSDHPLKQNLIFDPANVSSRLFMNAVEDANAISDFYVATSDACDEEHIADYCSWPKMP